MSNHQDYSISSLPWVANSQNSSPTTSFPDLDVSQSHHQNYSNQSRFNPQQPPLNTSWQSERPPVPTRSSTLGPPETDRSLSLASNLPQHARSEDLNHTTSTIFLGGSNPASSPRLSPSFLSSNHNSRPSTPSKLRNPGQSSSTGHTDSPNHRLSIGSDSSHHTDTSTHSGPSKLPPSSTTSTPTTLTSTVCSACGKSMQGPFVRALGTVYHLNCFTCLDCGDVVASKFFPIEGQDCKQSPLCERDYFKRLNLICAKCGMALRGSYITACNKKYHVEHFTCSLCPTLFGPQDSYYEHNGNVYCHFHYSTRFATKCVGCNTAILKQFVEINRNSRDECWHPECYMINKFWNVKVYSRRPTSTASADGEVEQPVYLLEEQRETPISLREKQVRMEQQVYRIWTVLSAFEESSAACISDMLRQVSNGQYLEAIRMAEKFILHVEVLFATIDDLEFHFARLNQKGMSHVREARMLCRKTVELFTLLSHTQETGARRMGMTQELLALVTGLAHYLKILIRIALTGALRLEREQSVRDAMASFLDRLHLLAVQGGNPAARRLLKGPNGEVVAPSPHGNFGTQGVTYGFRSLAPENAGESPFNPSAYRDGSSKPVANPPSDLCVKCGLTVEEDCVRLGTYQRWHSQCIDCATCGKTSVVPVPKEQIQSSSNSDEKENANKDQPPKPSTVRRPPANVGAFVYDIDNKKETTSFGEVPTVILCTMHAHPNCRGGFVAVQRLEQYAFLLNVALRRLYLLLKKQGVVPLSPGQSQSQSENPYRNSGDIMRMKSVHLDRKLSATARLPKRSTIVESPAGRSVHPSDLMQPQRQQDNYVTQSTAAPNQQEPTAGHVHSEPSQLNQLHVSPQQQQTARPNLHTLPVDSSIPAHATRPVLSRNNEVTIVDDSAPNSPAVGADENPIATLDDGITLADIPQLMEAAHAREQQRSLPRENAIPYVAELSALELAIVKHAALLALTKSPLKEQLDFDELLELVESKKSGFWNKIFKGDKKNIKKKGVFGIPLELLVERDGADSLLGATRATMRVPSFIDDVISAMKQMDMSVEGIFRKNGNIRRLRDLTEAIDRDPSSVDLTQDNPVQLAALLKKFLRELPDPLMTFKLHRLFIASQSLPSEQERKHYLHLISLLMPKSHRDTMEVLFVFLKWVASFAHMDAETGSKMDLGNLATVICPNILYSRGQNPMRDETFGALRVVTSFLENQDELFAVPSELLPILHDQEYFSNSLDLPGKEFLKKCDTYFKVKASNGRIQPSGSNGQINGNSHRYPHLNTAPIDRPLNAAQNTSDRSNKPHPGHVGIPQNGNIHPPLASPSLPQPLAQSIPRGQQVDESLALGPPRPFASPVTPRPMSYSPAQRPSSDHPAITHPSIPHSNSNGYPPAVRQRT
ncbi:hypothetical protein AMATHDRAFT_58104 [Amanita thiersii Skay4041]|uniref:RhoGAP-domain-containing protein n=1 Tax=Amanita thiersii Skay4041 TaxID=703135 RepID=A0A2A9NLN7_9AGAR|nr:hypothetical protein AMATHDRAFT_58104 [Amanita thiersii Skay4041]